MRTEAELSDALENWLTVSEITRGGDEDGFANGWVLALAWALEEPLIF